MFLISVKIVIMAQLAVIIKIFDHFFAVAAKQ